MIFIVLFYLLFIFFKFENDRFCSPSRWRPTQIPKMTLLQVQDMGGIRCKFTNQSSSGYVTWSGREIVLYVQKYLEKKKKEVALLVTTPSCRLYPVKALLCTIIIFGIIIIIDI